MSPEWMIAFDRIEEAARRGERGALADPLEREEWRGLEWASRLFARLSNGPREPAARRVKERAFGHAFAHGGGLRRF